VIGVLLILNNISTAVKNRASHRMHNARLIRALQSCDEIHALRVRASEAR
jgi:hypothetical protein